MICGAEIDRDDFWGMTPEGPAHIRCVLDRIPPAEGGELEGVGYEESLRLLEEYLRKGPRLDG